MNQNQYDSYLSLCSVPQPSLLYEHEALGYQVLHDDHVILAVLLSGPARVITLGDVHNLGLMEAGLQDTLVLDKVRHVNKDRGVHLDLRKTAERRD